MTCPGSKLRFAVIPLEGDSPRPVVARLPEIFCFTLSHKPRKELLYRAETLPGDCNSEAKREFLTVGDATIEKAFY